MSQKSSFIWWVKKTFSSSSTFGFRCAKTILKNKRPWRGRTQQLILGPLSSHRERCKVPVHRSLWISLNFENKLQQSTVLTESRDLSHWAILVVRVNLLPKTSVEWLFVIVFVRIGNSGRMSFLCAFVVVIIIEWFDCQEWRPQSKASLRLWLR